LRERAPDRFVELVPSLKQLLCDHAPVLVIDAASMRVQVGIFNADGTARWATQTDEAGIAIFRCVEQLAVEISTVKAFVFCEGPGSTLGIRTAAMAIRTWQTLLPRTCFAYSSLALVAHALAQPEITVIADARRDSWHSQKAAEALRRVTTAELTGPLVTPEHFRHWTPLPDGVAITPYDVPALLALAASTELFHATQAPDAFLHEEPSYASWIPQVHRAPAP
jgi:tRNA threonylcarbamoyladenosine biosynthesis protein TsaB